jgi:hypothetical protein
MGRPRRNCIFEIRNLPAFDYLNSTHILDGEKQYSQYALDSILVENGITVPQLESLLFEFVGSSSILSMEEVRLLISKTDVPTDKVDGVIGHLVKLSFFGVETSYSVFAYSDEPRELRKNQVLGDRFSELRGGSRRYQINPAFRSYLEVCE